MYLSFMYSYLRISVYMLLFGFGLAYGLGNLNRCLLLLFRGYVSILSNTHIVSIAAILYLYVSILGLPRAKPTCCGRSLTWGSVHGLYCSKLNRCLTRALLSVDITYICSDGRWVTGSFLLTNSTASHQCCDTRSRMRLKRRGWTKARLSKRTSG